jgi:predicted CoA-binding protein
MQHGRTVVPVNPRKEAAHGQPAYASLLDIPETLRVDVVDLFVASANAGAVADDAIKRGAKAVWFQLGVSDPQVWLKCPHVSPSPSIFHVWLAHAAQAAQRCKAAGLLVVEGTCPAIELHRQSQQHQQPIKH